MSILIKGMEMPKSCRECRFCNGQANTYYGVCAWCDVDGNARDAYTMQDCPLVPVPPHGRLIDADALKTMWDDEIARMLEKGIEYLDYHVDTLFSDFKHDVDKMPTIIPAEEGE